MFSFVCDKLYEFFHFAFIADGKNLWIATLLYIPVFVIPLGYLCTLLLKPWGLKSWNKQAIRNAKRIRQIELDRIHKEKELYDDETMGRFEEIGLLDFADLRDQLQDGRLTAVEAVTAFRFKSLDVNDRLNCVTCFVKEAPTWAAELDVKYGQLKDKPPLFGVPFSVKDNFFMTGYPCTRGLAKQLNISEKSECSLITHLRNLGAVPIVRTNVPQTMLAYVCSNPIYGTTLNPYNKHRTPGGSSGGEGCIVSAGGVAFGIGSDLAGSLRIPAHFCGISTLKPTADRLVVTGAHPGAPGTSRVSLSYGFFAKKTTSITTLFELTLVEEYFKMVPRTLPMPILWNSPKKDAQLRIAYAYDAGWFKATPSVVRAIDISKQVLEDQGHVLVPFQFPFHTDQTFSTIMKALLADNGYFLLNECYKYEPIDPLLYPGYAALHLPLFLRGLFAFLVKPFWPRLAITAGSYSKHTEDVRIAYVELDHLCRHFENHLVENKIDALILPVLPFPALPHNYPAKLPAAGFTTVLFNVLDLPAGTVPITHVTTDDIAELRVNYPPGVPSDPFYSLVKQAMLEDDATGLPVGVQVVTGAYQESTCLEVMRQLQEKSMALINDSQGE